MHILSSRVFSHKTLRNDLSVVKQPTSIRVDKSKCSVNAGNTTGNYSSQHIFGYLITASSHAGSYSSMGKICVHVNAKSH